MSASSFPLSLRQTIRSVCIYIVVLLSSLCYLALVSSAVPASMLDSKLPHLAVSEIALVDDLTAADDVSSIFADMCATVEFYPSDALFSYHADPIHSVAVGWAPALQGRCFSDPAVDRSFLLVGPPDTNIEDILQDRSSDPKTPSRSELKPHLEVLPEPGTVVLALLGLIALFGLAVRVR